MKNLLSIIFVIQPLLSTSQTIIVRHIDTISTSKHTTIKNFYADDNGFSIVEEKLYKKDDVIDTKFVSGEISSIDIDSLQFFLTKRNTFIIQINSNLGKDFIYMFDRNKRGLSVKHEDREITRYSIELPILKAKEFIKRIW